jgi:hypothetical protein
MDFGEPTKLQLCQSIAAALGYIALNGGDAVYPRALGLRQQQPRPLRGRAAFPRLCSWIESLKAPEQTSETLNRVLRSFAASSARPGVVLILSDGLDPDVPMAIRALGGRGHEVWFLQILSEVEVDPDLEGDLKLIDGEGGRPVEITANGIVLKEYRKRLEAHNAALADATRRVGGRYELLVGQRSVEQVLSGVLRRKGWLA